jgi:two-component system chemotaxis sensor kinase CheA
MALPLSVVIRIESIALKDVEYAGGRPLLQYRGDLLPLDDRGGVLQEMEAADPEALATVLICQRPARNGGAQKMGIVVRRVVEVANGDMLESNAEICTERIAKVNERVTVVHEAFAAGGRMREVA